MSENIFDINTYTLLSLCNKYKMPVNRSLIVKDDEELGKYFDEDGIKQVEEKKLTDL